MEWQLSEAEKQVAKVVRAALTDGPQVLTVEGRPAAVVLSAQAYDALTGVKPPTDAAPDFIEDLLSGPEWDDDFIEAVNDRTRDTGRDIDP